MDNDPQQPFDLSAPMTSHCLVTAIALAFGSPWTLGPQQESAQNLCSGPVSSINADAHHVSRPDAGTLCFAGNIDGQAVEAFRTLLEEKPLPEQMTLVIRSMGGDVREAIRLRRMLEGHHLHVIVHASCMSSCANYIFATAERKTILPQSMVLFHGGMSDGFLRKMKVDLRKESRIGNDATAGNLAANIASFDELQGLERTLLSEHGVSHELTSQFDIFNRTPLRQRPQDCRRKPDVSMVAMSPARLQSLGVTNVFNEGPSTADELNALIRAKGGDPALICWMD